MSDSNRFNKYDMMGGGTHLQVLESIPNKIYNIERYLPIVKIIDEDAESPYQILKDIPMRDNNVYPNTSTTRSVSLYYMVEFEENPENNLYDEFGYLSSFLRTYPNSNTSPALYGFYIISTPDDTENSNYPKPRLVGSYSKPTLYFDPPIEDDNSSFVNGEYHYEIKFVHEYLYIKPERVSEAIDIIQSIVTPENMDYVNTLEQVEKALSEKNMYEYANSIYDYPILDVTLTIRDYVPAARFDFPDWTPLQREDGTMSNIVPKGEGPYECIYRIDLGVDTKKGVLDDEGNPIFQCNLYPQFYTHIEDWNSSPKNGLKDGFSYTENDQTGKIVMTWYVQFSLNNLTENDSVKLRIKFTTINDVPYTDSENTQDTWKVQSIKWTLNEDGENFTITIN